MNISENLNKISAALPKNVKLLVATKSRSVSEIEQVLACEQTLIGENYVQEAEKKFVLIGKRATWHLIGHLQKNKVKKAARIFDLVETLDSLELAALLDREAAKLNKIIDVLIEVNSGCEANKNGVLPENVLAFVEAVAVFKNLRLRGLMTMGPALPPKQLIPFFKLTYELFQQIKNSHQGLKNWDLLSMGMSDSYLAAIEQGANLVRLGTVIFGPR